MKCKKILIALSLLTVASCQNNVEYKEAPTPKKEPVVQEQKKETATTELFGQMCADDRAFNGY